MDAQTMSMPIRSDLVRTDQGAVNERILARATKVDFRRVESAGVKMRARFTSAEGKRLFVRRFATLQLNTHFISVIARTRLDHKEIVRMETVLRERLDGVAAMLNQAIDGVEALFKAHGITAVAAYDTLPLEIDVAVLSSSGRRYLEVIGKFDQLMPLLQTLEIHEVMTVSELDHQRALTKRDVKDISTEARSFATELRRRMNAMQAREGKAKAEITETLAEPSEDRAGADGAGDGAVVDPSSLLDSAANNSAAEEHLTGTPEVEVPG